MPTFDTPQPVSATIEVPVGAVRVRRSGRRMPVARDIGEGERFT